MKLCDIIVTTGEMISSSKREDPRKGRLQETGLVTVERRIRSYIFYTLRLMPLQNSVAYGLLVKLCKLLK